MIRAVLTDIEGTTSSIEFVHRVLFPYSAQAMPAFVKAHAEDAAVNVWLQRVQQEISPSQASTLQLDAITAKLREWIAQDVKHPALKALQGMIWRAGYEAAHYQGHVYADVAPALAAWRQQNRLLYVYSSGSVAAQKLLFRFSEAGDLSGLFDGFFDTAVGHKRDAASYRAIAQAIGLLPARVLFLSDIEAELDAASEAGMACCQLLRAGAAASSRHPHAHNFSDIRCNEEHSNV
jgi:enolase-phosphatase E1